MPTWADEGLPSFSRRVWDIGEGQSMILHLGYQNPWRINELGDPPCLFGSGKYYKRGWALWNKSRSASFPFFRIVRGVSIHSSIWCNRTVRTAMEPFSKRPLIVSFPDIQPLWTSYIRNILDNRQSIFEIPPTEVLEKQGCLQGLHASQ